MYVPRHNQVQDRAAIIGFMRAHSFAAIISHGESGIRATHLPLLIEDPESTERLRIFGHMAKANPQWRGLVSDAELLLIFTGPHAYVSPRLYERAESVPTWNYAAVHAYGTAQLIETAEEKHALLERLITLYDTEYLEQFRSLRSEYVDNRLSAVVAFSIDVTRLEARFKLSQDRLPTERARVIEALTSSDDGAARQTAQLMRDAERKQP